ncbi:MAG: type II secretion system GspH family protein, partial [Candidatus Gastranaerophilales bacterium]|nr:type II secretion system GspH family protein [Candidatus Gastranaerophilales bacterium]
MTNKSRIGFTLAEVLITLGIIGVIATITIPGLITKYRRSVVETKLKKFYSTINQAIRHSIADNEDFVYMDVSDVNTNNNSEKILNWYK